MLASCVLYAANEVPFFNKKTAIQPENCHNIAHEHFVRYSKLNKFVHLGKMPEDFHAKLVSAIKNSILLKPKEIDDLLLSISEI